MLIVSISAACCGLALGNTSRNDTHLLDAASICWEAYDRVTCVS